MSEKSHGFNTLALHAGQEVDVVMEDRVRMELYLTNQKTVLQEMKSAVEAYTKLFGPIPYKTIRAGMGLSNTSLGLPTLLVAKFVPGLSTVAPPLAGSSSSTA